MLIEVLLFGRRRHKSDCLCAICVLKRRRKEREETARIAKDQNGAGNNPAQELNFEVTKKCLEFNQTFLNVKKKQEHCLIFPDAIFYIKEK